MARILIVDDDPDYVEITRTVLQKEGYEIEAASNGKDAMLRMRQRKPDLVLLDIMMSYVLDGINVSRQMRADPTLQDVPIVIISSLTGVQSNSIYPSDDSATIDGWISKPVNPEELKQKVSEMLKERAAQ